MSDHNKSFTITYGGWYQRTTIHLTEIYDFMRSCKTRLKFSLPVLKSFHASLKLKEVTREVGYLEYVQAETTEGIIIKYYEDGLYILKLRSNEISKGKKLLQDYYEKSFEPAIKYIFSLGAPIPKILADITSVHPTVISLESDTPSNFEIDKELYGEVYSRISSDDITVYKTPEYIFALADKKNFDLLDDIVGMQIFFREFKDQLEKYVDIHRIVWEDIDKIKDQKSIKGKDVDKVRFKLEMYNKTVNLITHRINQMGTYVTTRASISKSLKIEEYLVNLFQYKFEVLSNTLEYIKEIWAMTNSYLQSAIKIVVEIQDETTDASIKSLRIVTALGVVAGLGRYLFQEEFPKVTIGGLVYFVILILFTWLLDLLIVWIYRQIKYKLKFVKGVTRF
ncbi:MAG: hypothetical protein PHS44_00905 [Candidatus Dojkabacteria bacterium]|nr:hypothetical protein [Candidatus Dojkabacteria bacterium]